MPYSRTTLSKFIIEDQRRVDCSAPDLTSLLNDIQTACKLIAVAAARGRIAGNGVTTFAGNGVTTFDGNGVTTFAGNGVTTFAGNGVATQVNVQGEQQQPLDVIANDIMLGTCEWGGQLAGMVSEELDTPYEIPAHYPQGRYLLVFDPLDGSSNVDINMPVGSIFSVLRCPDGVDRPTAADFLQPGTAQVAAGYAIYGATTMLVLTLGDGVHGFTLDPEIGAFILTHPGMTIAPDTREFAVNVSNERFWEPPVRRYVDECLEGSTGVRGVDFNMRWIAAMVAEVHRILIRGGVFMYPLDTKQPTRPGRLSLLYEASPMAMLVEQAGGAASTGRERILDIVPADIHQRVPVILGSANEVARLAAYHAEYDSGEDRPFVTPLFNRRSLFRTA